MNMQPYKWTIQATVQTVDGKGNITGEIVGQPVTVYGTAALKKWARDFEKNLTAEAAKVPPAA